MHAGTAARLDKNFQEIAQKIGIRGFEDPNVDKLDLIKNWLEGDRSGRWLLVLDNMDDLGIRYGSNRLIDQLPICTRGSILLTTRDKAVGLKFAGPKRLISVGALENSDSGVLLSHKLSTTATIDDLHRLAVVLENVPLSLVHAAAFIAVNDLSVTEYLDLYNKSESSKTELLSEEFEDEVSYY